MSLLNGVLGAVGGYFTGGPAGAVAGGVGGLAAGDAADADNEARQQALDLARQQRADNQKFIQEQVQKTQGQLFQLFPQIQHNQNAGMLAGLNTLKQGMGAQLNAFNGGNMNAQQTLLGGIPQANNALLGKPVDYSRFQARQVMPPPEVATGNYAAPPQFSPIDVQALGGVSGQGSPPIDYNALAAALGGNMMAAYNPATVGGRGGV